MRWLLIIACVSFIAAGCRKESSLPDLGPNKWNQDIPNPILIDSVVTKVQNPTVCSLYVYFHFDLKSFEEEWDLIEGLNFSIDHVGPTQKPTSAVVVELDEEGNGVAYPEYSYTLSKYDISHLIRLENGRTTLPSPTMQITTPSY